MYFLLHQHASIHHTVLESVIGEHKHIPDDPLRCLLHTKSLHPSYVQCVHPSEFELQKNPDKSFNLYPFIVSSIH